jgi:hypothetical protein
VLLRWYRCSPFLLALLPLHVLLHKTFLLRALHYHKVPLVVW